MAENLAYNNFKKFYYNLIERGGNIGTADITDTEERYLERPKEWTRFIRNYHHNINWKHYTDNHLIDDFHRRVRGAVQCLWMADQSIVYKPIVRREPGNTFCHPGVSRLNARWAQNLSTECIVLDF